MVKQCGYMENKRITWQNIFQLGMVFPQQSPPSYWHSALLRESSQQPSASQLNTPVHSVEQSCPEYPVSQTQAPVSRSQDPFPEHVSNGSQLTEQSSVKNPSSQIHSPVLSAHDPDPEQVVAGSQNTAQPSV